MRREKPAIFLETAMSMSAMHPCPALGVLPGGVRARARDQGDQGHTFATHRRRQPWTRHSSIYSPRLCTQSSQRHRSRRIPAILSRRAAVRFEDSFLKPHTTIPEIEMLGYRYNYVCVLKNAGRSDEQNIALLFGKLLSSATIVGRRDTLY